MRWRLKLICSGRSALLVLVLYFAGGLMGWAADSPAQNLARYLSQHGYGALAVTASEMSNRQVIQTSINGRRVPMVIDTGCESTCITASCARQLKLDVHETRNFDMGTGGLVKGHTGLALVSSFVLDKYEINRTNTIQVLSKQAYLQDQLGLFGLDYLKDNAVILPVGAPYILFKPGNTPVPPLDSFMAALGFKAIPLHARKGGLMIEGQLDGKPLNAIVDCGAALSFFDMDFVYKTASASTFTGRSLPARGLDGRETRGFVFTAKNLVLGSLPIKRMEFTAGSSVTFKVEGFNALIGYDFLASHEAIIDLGHDTLWVKPE